MPPHAQSKTKKPIIAIIANKDLPKHSLDVALYSHYLASLVLAFGVD